MTLQEEMELREQQEEKRELEIIRDIRKVLQFKDVKRELR